ncbi:hypothetical protein [Cytobacillus sp. IB215665]|uniref:hypothetical protein n=1 Tax=Cytobacillus sp. IB215665 TaxID=3097357 RepID=UPI002A15DBF4|nr:hypothetical protein [Cytobacillus sp. IB215665]MDX8366066.1 hypothetical protein [Cytobacillus sp. IB215665]
MKRLVFVIIFIFFLAFYLEYGKGKQLTTTSSIEFSEQDHIQNIMINEEKYGFEQIDTKEQVYLNSKDTIYTYQILTSPISFLNITKRTLDNGDFFIFTSLQNNSTNPIDVTVTFPIPEVSHYTLQPFDQFLAGRRYNEDIGFDLTTNPLGLLTTYNGSEYYSNVMISKIYHSKELSQIYEDERESIVRELISENRDVDVIVKKDHLQIKLDMESLGEDIVDHWSLFSEKQLFTSDNSFSEWIKKSNYQKWKTNSWYTAKGPYKKLVTTVEPLPESQLNYGRNLLLVKDFSALEEYKETKERYFYDLVLNSIANLTVFKGNKEFWETEITSTWLKKEYGIEAPYIDTRHNEGIALFLEETGDLLEIPELKIALLNYADLLVDQIESRKVLEIAPDAFLISDYFSFYQDTLPTHSSLNHVLGGLNLLLKSYIETKNEEYLKCAYNIQNAIDLLGEKWLTDEGDTWYQIGPDMTFQGEDYTLLTLEDLLHTYELWKEIDSKKINTIEMLITSKAAYLINKEVGLSQEIVKLLINNGFSEIIKNYNNILPY